MKYEPMVMAVKHVLSFVILETQTSSKIVKYQCYSDEHVLCDIAQVCLIL